MKIAVLERNSVGEDVDISLFEQLGEVVTYPVTKAGEVSERIRGADIIVNGKNLEMVWQEG